MTSQSINDRINAARLSIAGQGLAKSVCKATTEEVIGPKKKHLDYLLHCTNEPNVSIPQMANCLIERTNHTSWVVVFKALITVHHLMCYGNERFTQYLASSNCNFQLGGFLDKTGVQGYDMSTFIRRYAKYLNEKAISYRTVAFDFCKVKRGKDDGILRSMNAEKLLKTLPGLQNQLDALLEFDCTANELTNGVINTAFMLLFRDLIRLFACYNDGIINLLEKYFDMNKKMCRDALDIYKKFLIRMDRVAEFLKTAENVGIDKGDIPDLTKAPSSLLDALEQHLATLEGKKGGPGGATTPTQVTAGRQSSVKNAVLALSNTSSAFGTAAASSTGPRQNRVNGSGGGEEDHLKQLALEEEQAILELHKERRIKELESAGGGGSSTNPFLSSPTDENVLFGSPPDGSDLVGLQATGKASDDLLCLANNPFSDGLGTGINQSSNLFWSDQNGLSAPNNTFVPEASFGAVFGSSGNSQAIGMNKAVRGPTPESESGMEKATSDLTISGLNPFEGASSTTPSPSVPFQFGGLGTTPILGAPEHHTFPNFADFGPLSNVASGMGEGDRKATTGFEANFPFGSDSITLSAEPRSRSLSPAPGSQAPKPTPASSPPPPLDTFGELSFGTATLPTANQGTDRRTLGTASPSRAVASSAVDDLNAAIKAALTGSPQAMGGMASGGGAISKCPDNATVPFGMPSVGANLKQSPGFGSPNKVASDFDAFGDILQPVSTTAATSSSPSMSRAQNKVITGDLDSSLASLAENLSINRPGGLAKKSGNMWNSPKNTAKTGGANWTPQIASSTAAPAWNSPQHTYQPMANVAGKPADWSGGMMAGHFPPAVGQQAFSGGSASSIVSATQPPMAAGNAKAFSGAVPSGPPLHPQQRATTMDPFGAL